MASRTRFLARLAGMFLVVVSFAMLARGAAIAAGAAALIRDPAALLVLEAVGLCAGLAMVLGHNVWSGGVLPVVVTLVGWTLLFRSALLLFLPPAAVAALFEALRVGALHRLYAVVGLLIGGWLTYASFRR